MLAKQTEVRVDPADGKEYPLTAFLEFYGEDEGQRRWATVGQQHAYRYFSVACACVMFLRIFLSVCSFSTRTRSARLS